MCERFRSSPALQAPKQLPTVTRTSSSGMPAAASFSRMAVSNDRSPFQQQRSLPQVRISYLAICSIGPSSTCFSTGLPPSTWDGEDIVDQVSIDPFVLDRHLAGNEHAHDRLAAAAAGAAGAMQEDVGASRCGDVFAKLVEHLVGPGGLFAGGRSDLDANRTPRD